MGAGAGAAPGSLVASPALAATEIRRADSANPEAFREFFAGLSTQTRYLRFFAPVSPTAAMLRSLSGRGPAGWTR